MPRHAALSDDWRCVCVCACVRGGGCCERRWHAADAERVRCLSSPNGNERCGGWAVACYCSGVRIQVPVVGLAPELHLFFKIISNSGFNGCVPNTVRSLIKFQPAAGLQVRDPPPQHTHTCTHLRSPQPAQVRGSWPGSRPPQVLLAWCCSGVWIQDPALRH